MIYTYKTFRNHKVIAGIIRANDVKTAFEIAHIFASQRGATGKTILLKPLF